MAEDLTAGRAYPPDARPEPVVAGPGEDLPVSADDSPRRGERSPFRRRFALAYLGLAVVAGAAVGAAILLVDRPPTREESWSSWRPDGRESSYPRQIADYVSGRYRLPSGNTLVAVIASKPQVETRDGPVPLQAVAIQNDPEGASDDISVESAEGSVMYTLCGLGERCSIREGEPSEARMRLLRREALELALYSFKYVDDLRSVITLLPTNLGEPDDPNDDTSVALFFRKRDLSDALERPLVQTLSSPRPPRAAQITSLEGVTIDRLTEPRLFRYEFTQTQAGGAVIVLAPVDPG